MSCACTYVSTSLCHEKEYGCSAECFDETFEFSGLIKLITREISSYNLK